MKSDRHLIALCGGFVSHGSVSSAQRCDRLAPKGHKNIAQGFNPGLVAPTRFALEGQQIRCDRLRSEPTIRRTDRTDSDATFRAHPIRTANPGLKPWAMIHNRFAVTTKISWPALLDCFETILPRPETLRWLQDLPHRSLAPAIK